MRRYRRYRSVHLGTAYYVCGTRRLWIKMQAHVVHSMALRFHPLDTFVLVLLSLFAFLALCHSHCLLNTNTSFLSSTSIRKFATQRMCDARDMGKYQYSNTFLMKIHLNIFKKKVGFMPKSEDDVAHVFTCFN